MVIHFFPTLFSVKVLIFLPRIVSHLQVHDEMDVSMSEQSMKHREWVACLSYMPLLVHSLIGSIPGPSSCFILCMENSMSMHYGLASNYECDNKPQLHGRWYFHLWGCAMDIVLHQVLIRKYIDRHFSLHNASWLVFVLNPFFFFIPFLIIYSLV